MSQRLYEILIKINHVTVIDKFDFNYLDSIKNISTHVFYNMDYILNDKIKYQEMHDICFSNVMDSIVIINDSTGNTFYDLEIFYDHFCFYRWSRINVTLEEL